MAARPFKKELVLPTMPVGQIIRKTVDRKVITSGLQIKIRLTPIKFFLTAHNAPSKSVVVAAATQTHPTFTQLLYQSSKTTNKVSALWTIALVIVTLRVSAQIPVIVEPKPFTFSQPHIVKTNMVTQTGNRALTSTSYSLDVNERNRQIKNEIDDYSKKQEQQRKFIEDAMRELNVPQIEYSFKPSGLKGRRNFHKSYDQITKMLTGESKASLKRAVFLSEFAYDTTMNYENFNQEISEIVRIVGLKMMDEKISPTDNMGKIMTLFQFMADTI